VTDRNDWKARKKAQAATGYRKKKRKYWKLKEEALDCAVWRTRFGRGNGAVAIQTTE
jgi:hypothetical protein